VKIAASVIASLVVAHVLTPPAFAQGKSASAPGQNKNKGSGSAAAASGAISTSTASPAASSSGTSLYFGSWLDDASVLPVRSAWLGVSTAYWKADVARQIDSPVVMAAASFGSHLQIGGSLPIYHFRGIDGASDSGLGTVSVYGKAQLVSPDSNPHRVGLAVAPLLELSNGAAQRFGLAMPVNVETRIGSGRVYGSLGYFSRGSFFTAAAGEVPLGARAAFTANIGNSYSAGLRRTDLGAGIAVFGSAGTTLFASVGRSLGPTDVDAGSTGISLGGGVSFLMHR